MNIHKKQNVKIIFGIIFLLLGTYAFSANKVIDLVVGYKTVNFSGKKSQAIAVNNQIPAPSLHFKEGDHVTINVYNHLDQETAIHWHGVLVPWQMDGVLGISQRGIPPSGIFHYRFTLHQSGTYWYHAHAGLQEQLGVYGAFIIDPRRPSDYKYTKDYSVVLSDWSNTYPDQILAHLKKDGDYYAPRFPLQPSLAKFIHDYRKADKNERNLLLDDYKMMQQMRMSIYDLSDVAYDAFLLNGHSRSAPWTALVKPGDIVRLRFIGAAADTIYRVKLSDSPIQIVNIQGNDIVPYTVKDFTIAPGETIDILVHVKQKNPVVIYAEARDRVGAAYGALVTSPAQFVNYSQIAPFSEPLPVTREMMYHTMMNKGTSMHGASMNRMNMHMATEPSVMGDTIASIHQKTMNHQAMQETTMGTKYQNLTAAVKTNDPDKPVYGVIKMELFGYMGRFIWFINGLPEYRAKPIIFEPGKRYRFVFTNPSMMHHPMHIHGHWFILRNGHGAYDPLLHTIDVPPSAVVTADVDADASGQSFFHCHLLYHMVAGMSRVFQYSTLIEITKNEKKPEHIIKQTAYLNRPLIRVDETRPIDISLIHHPMAHPMGFYFSNLLDVGEDPFDNIQKITFKGMYGYDYNKLELFINDAEINKGTVENADTDIFYWHLLDQFWAVKGGVNYFYRPATTPYWQLGIGIEGLIPYFIDTDMRGYYHNGSTKLDIELSRDTQITNNFFIRLGVRGILASKTVEQAAIGSGLNQMRYMIRPYYRLMPGLNIFAEYENERDYGAFKNILSNHGESTGQSTVTLGFSILL